MRSYKELRAYTLSTQLADHLHAEALEWSSFDLWTVGVQLVRAADSVGANIAEASGRQTNPDQRRFLLIARASLETEHWIARGRTRGFLPTGSFDETVQEVARTLNGLIARSHRQGRHP
jgi:four helix bundle protein